MPNVFLPLKKSIQAEVEFVHPYLFEKCRSFFENVLHLKTPNEYDHLVKSLEKRYAGTDFSGSFEEHVQDIHAIVKYLRNSDYEDDLRQMYGHLHCLRLEYHRNHLITIISADHFEML